MKIYTTYSQTHKIFMPWFNTIKNIEPDIDPVYTEIEQLCPTGEFNSDGWNKVTEQKLQTLKDITYSDKNEFFVFSDIDVQFFKPVWKLGEQALQNHDIVFQNDYYGKQCTGFFYCRNNKKTRQLFEEALKIHHLHRDDQTSIQAALVMVPGLRHALLPKEYFTYGMYFDHWHGQSDFLVPKNMVMHHANWVIGVDNKIKLLKATRSNYEQQRFIQ